MTMLPVENRLAVSFCTNLLGAGTSQEKSGQQTSAEVELALLSHVGRWRT